MKISDSVAMVTGGASGLGLATVQELHAHGANVVILDLPSSQGKTIAEELGDRVTFHHPAGRRHPDEPAMTMPGAFPRGISRAAWPGEART